MQLNPANVYNLNNVYIYNLKNCSENMSKSLPCPCPWYCGCSSVSGSRYGRCCHQTNNNKTWSGTQPPNIHGRPSIILTSTALSGTVLQKYHFAKCGDQFSASSDDNCVHIDLNNEKSARKERFWKYLQATSVQRRPCLGAVMMSLCHTEASCP